MRADLTVISVAFLLGSSKLRNTLNAFRVNFFSCHKSFFVSVKIILSFFSLMKCLFNSGKSLENLKNYSIYNKFYDLLNCLLRTVFTS